MLVNGPKSVVNASAEWKLSFLMESDPRVIKEWCLSTTIVHKVFTDSLATTTKDGKKVPCTGVEVFWFPLNSHSKIASTHTFDGWKPRKDRLYTR